MSRICFIRYTIIVSFLLGIQLVSYSQKIISKVYGNILKLDTSYTEEDPYTLAVEIITKSGRSHEFEWTEFYFQNSDNLSTRNSDTSSAFISKLLRFGVSYKYKYPIFYQNNSFSFHLFLSPSTIFIREMTLPIVHTTYETNHNLLYSTLSILPGISYNYNEILYLDIRIPLDLFYFGINHSHIENPSLSEDLQSSVDYNWKFLPIHEIKIKLGIGIRINKKTTK